MPTPMQEHIGKRLAQLRHLRKLKQRELAEAIGTSTQTISNWETGVSHIPSIDLPAVATVLGVTIEDLYASTLPPAARPRFSDDRQRLHEALDRYLDAVELKYRSGDGGWLVYAELRRHMDLDAIVGLLGALKSKWA